ncbi:MULTISPECIES: helix-turn-helix transcriptional regulator [unclassified Leifsonia]|uniref:helix-turn-helix transcriptional regulator n=1 Tax=unclassified Leifsonia TaxID=2663824 RepID=UPI0006F9492A|nr:MULTISPECIES: WYL domain-containing protein [unclassified Leifsonia]KQX06983.1 DNA-binding transcriptional regulator [Leifsonia sp. Root1293]KRA11267.1 DNA-binding transcriptional regulator [Leifsonia sp. Root60]
MAERRRTLLGADRTLFMLSVVPYLLDRGAVSVEEVAEHFDVTPDLVRRTIALLPMTGIPGESKAYLDNDLFEIDYDALEEGTVILTRNIVIDEAPRFSAREAAALIAGLKYLSALPENADSDAIGVLLAKLARGSSAIPAEMGVEAGIPDATRALLRSAASAGSRVAFVYRSSRGEAERRVVDPLRLESIDRDWYLRAWDHAREALRTFRLDRMDAVEVLDEPATRTIDDFSLSDEIFQGSPDDLEVVIEVPVDALPLLTDFRPEGQEPGSAPGLVRTTLRVAHHHGLKRIVAGYAGIITVVSPPEARRVVAEWAAAGAEQYADSDSVER